MLSKPLKCPITSEMVYFASLFAKDGFCSGYLESALPNHIFISRVGDSKNEACDPLHISKLPGWLHCEKFFYGNKHFVGDLVDMNPSFRLSCRTCRDWSRSLRGSLPVITKVGNYLSSYQVRFELHDTRSGRQTSGTGQRRSTQVS